MMRQLQRAMWFAFRVAAVVAVIAALGSTGAAADPAGTGIGLRRFTTQYRLEDCTFADRDTGDVGNPLFPLIPGRRLVLEGNEDGELVRVEITVLDETETITFETQDGEELTVETRVVEERESADGEPVELSLNWLARCVETSDIFYFGEDVTPDEGEWRAGENGALPGLIMPGTFLLGSRYFQELAAGVALDRAENLAMGVEVTVPAGTFTNCVGIRETTPLEPGQPSFKAYCPGVGLVIDNVVRLVEIDP